MFGATAVFGTVTKRSLAGFGQFLFMGLIGLILASIVGLFWQSGALQFVISVVGVLVFTGLTAWDAQRLKQMAVSLPDGRVGAYAVVGALSLYLDFINLFFFLLRFTGGRKGTRSGVWFRIFDHRGLDDSEPSDVKWMLFNRLRQPVLYLDDSEFGIMAHPIWLHALSPMLPTMPLLIFLLD